VILKQKSLTAGPFTTVQIMALDSQGKTEDDGCHEDDTEKFTCLATRNSPTIKGRDILDMIFWYNFVPDSSNDVDSAPCRQHYIYAEKAHLHDAKSNHPQCQPAATQLDRGFC